MLEIGIKHSETLLVSHEHTAKTLQSGGMEVLATPALITIMEKCAWKSVLPYMKEGIDTVGIEINMKHLSPTPIGFLVKCKSELTNINGNVLTFLINAYNDKEKIGEAIHKRYIINIENFTVKTLNKA